jgi:hypothetical protein
MMMGISTIMGISPMMGKKALLVARLQKLKRRDLSDDGDLSGEDAVLVTRLQKLKKRIE